MELHLQCGLESSRPRDDDDDDVDDDSNGVVNINDDDGLARLSAEEHASLDLLAHLAYPSSFDTLRTKEQLGYLVSAHSSRFAGVTGLTVVVQSSSAGPAFLQERIDAWLAGFGDELRDMPEDEVAQNAGSLAALLLEKSRSMGEEHDAHAGEVLGMRYDFGRRQRRAAEIAKVTKDQLVAAYDRHVAPGGAGRRSIRLHFYSRSHFDQEQQEQRGEKEEQEEEEEGKKDEAVLIESLSDLRTFKEPLPRFPSTSRPWWR